MPEERYLRTIAGAPLSEQAAVWTKQKPKKGQTASWYAIANSLAKRQMFARDAKFGEKEAGRLRHRLDRRPVRPGRRGQPLHDRRRRLSWRTARLARSQLAEERGNRSSRRLRRSQAPEGRDPGLGRQAREKGSGRTLRRPRNGAVSEVCFTPPAPAAKASKTGAGEEMLRPLNPGPVPTSPRRAAR